MRISVWSSDVCASDLLHRTGSLQEGALGRLHLDGDPDALALLFDSGLAYLLDAGGQLLDGGECRRTRREGDFLADHRSEERGVGQEGVSSFRPLWSPFDNIPQETVITLR